MIRALILFFLLSASAARADLAFIRASDLGDNGGSTNNLTTAFDATSANLLVISIIGDHTTAGGGGNDDNIATVTYAGAGATFIVKQGGTTSWWHYLYYILNPATGSNNIVISTTGTSHYILALAAAYSGADTIGSQPGASAASVDSGNNDAYASSLSTSPDRAWVMLAAANTSFGATPTCSSGATRRIYNVAFNLFEMCDSNGPVTPTQSYSMTATISNGGFPQSHLMASFGPVLSGLRGLTLMGCCQ